MKLSRLILATVVFKSPSFTGSLLAAECYFRICTCNLVADALRLTHRGHVSSFIVSTTSYPVLLESLANCLPGAQLGCSYAFRLSRSSPCAFWFSICETASVEHITLCTSLPAVFIFQGTVTGDCVPLARFYWAYAQYTGCQGWNQEVSRKKVINS